MNEQGERRHELILQSKIQRLPAGNINFFRGCGNP
jgi:hypothetical protein